MFQDGDCLDGDLTAVRREPSLWVALVRFVLGVGERTEPDNGCAGVAGVATGGPLQVPASDASTRAGLDGPLEVVVRTPARPASPACKARLRSRPMVDMIWMRQLRLDGKVSPASLLKSPTATEVA